MVFAGDFAQLPPAVGGEGVSLYSHSIGFIASSMKSQEEAIGKALWHQVTTVVILRQNVRQKVQSLLDSQLRTALENMRYKACTPEDIRFLTLQIYQADHLFEMINSEMYPLQQQKTYTKMKLTNLELVDLLKKLVSN